MSKETITVKYVNEPKEGKKKGNIKTTDGRIFGVWPDKLDQFKVGGTYEIETESNEFNGKMYHSVKSATAVNGSTAAPTPAAQGYSNGRSPETQARIERQHSQEMALRLVLFLGIGAKTAGGTDEIAADEAKKKLNYWTDYFQADIANSVAKDEVRNGFEL